MRKLKECAVCNLVYNDSSLKMCTYCQTCDDWFCDLHKNSWAKRIKAMLIKKGLAMKKFKEVAVVATMLLVPVLSVLPVYGRSLKELKIKATGHSVTLSGCKDTDTQAQFNFYRGTVSGGPYTKLNSTPVSTCSFTDSTVVYGTTYFYVATAVANDSNFTGESGFSNQVNGAIPTAVTTTTLAATTQTPLVGQNVTLTATVASPDATLTGSVQFLDGTTSLGTQAVSSGTASFGVSTLALGDHSITAKYSGDSQNATSTSNVVTVTVSNPPAPPVPTGLTGVVN